MSIAVVVGTRPEIIKLAPLVEELGPRAEVTYTGQHYDDDLAGAFFDTFGMPRPSSVVRVADRSRGAQIGATTLALSERWERTRPDAIVVQGDTNSGLAGALAANAVGRPLIHLEAGLRSGDRAMPEEHNRVVVDHLSDLLLAPTDVARDALYAEAITAPTEVVGNTVVEAVQRLMPPPERRARLLADHGVDAGAFVLATVHRPENTDDRSRLAAIMRHLAALDVPVLFPMHPRTRHRIVQYHLEPSLDGLRVLPPLTYADFLGLCAEAGLLVSDSGGIQEEASVYKRPLLVVRSSTERPEVMGTFAALVEPDHLGELARRWLTDLAERHRWLADLPCPFGEGDTSRLAARSIRELID